jgi:hypothetical protein
MLVPRAKTSPAEAKAAEAAEAAGRTMAVSSAQAAAQAARTEAANVSVMLEGAAAAAGGGGGDERALSALAHSKVHPRMLHSAATSHSWPFAAIAELVDNAQDAECESTSVWVEGQLDGFYQNRGFVKVEDDGRGLTRDAMVRTDTGRRVPSPHTARQPACSPTSSPPNGTSTRTWPTSSAKVLTCPNNYLLTWESGWVAWRRCA